MSCNKDESLTTSLLISPSFFEESAGVSAGGVSYGVGCSGSSASASKSVFLSFSSVIFCVRKNQANTSVLGEKRN